MSNQSSHGTFRNRRRSQSDTGFRIIAAVVGFVVLVALIAMATALLKLRDNVYELQGARPVVGNTAVSDELEALRTEVAELKSQSALRAGTAAQDRGAIKAALARLLHQHEADSAVINALLEGVSDEDRAEIVADVGGADPMAGHRGIREAVAILEQELAAIHGGNGSGDDPQTHQEPGAAQPDGQEPEGPDEEVTPTPEPPAPETTEEPDETYPPAPPDEEPEPGPEPPPSPQERYVEYTVVKGDNLSKIADKHSVTMEAIIEANGIENPNLIPVGAVLKIPVEE